MIIQQLSGMKGRNGGKRQQALVRRITVSLCTAHCSLSCLLLLGNEYLALGKSSGHAFIIRILEATRNKCIATSNKCLTSSNKKLVETIISNYMGGNQWMHGKCVYYGTTPNIMSFMTRLRTPCTARFMGVRQSGRPLCGQHWEPQEPKRFGTAAVPASAAPWYRGPSPAQDALPARTREDSLTVVARRVSWKMLEAFSHQNTPCFARHIHVTLVDLSLTARSSFVSS